MLSIFNNLEEKNIKFADIDIFFTGFECWQKLLSFRFYSIF